MVGKMKAFSWNMSSEREEGDRVPLKKSIKNLKSTDSYRKNQISTKLHSSSSK